MSKLLPFNAIIEIVSEEHELAVRKRAYEMGYTKGNSHSRVLAWIGGCYTEKAYCVELTVDGRQEYSSKEFYQSHSEYKDHKWITLTDLYLDHEDEKTKEIKERIKKCEEELASLRGML